MDEEELRHVGDRSSTIEAIDIREFETADEQRDRPRKRAPWLVRAEGQIGACTSR